MTQTLTAEPVASQDKPEAPAETGRGRLRRIAPAVLAILAGLALIAWRASIYGNWIVDDAAITFAYARDVADGLGPVVAPGSAPVEGFSNPTWLVLLVLGRLLGLFDHGTWFGIPDYVLFPKLLGLLCCAGILVLCHHAARAVTKRPWLATFLAAAVMAAIPSFVIWCFSGLENSLYALLAVGIAVLLFRATIDGRLLTARVGIIAGVLAALAALTRPDGAIYAGAYPLAVLVHLHRDTIALSVRRILVSVAAFIVPFGLYLLWRYLEFGKLVPNTSVAKSQGLPTVANLNRIGELLDYVGPALVLAALIGIGFALAKCPWRAALATLLVPLTLAVLAYVVIEPDWMGQFRFATPVWALLAITGTLGVFGALAQCKPRGQVVLSLGLAVSAAASGSGLMAQAHQFRSEPTLSMCYVADRIGRTFNAYADMLGLKGGTLLAPDLGGSSLTSRLHIVDMAGLAEPHIAELINHGDMPGLRDYVFNQVKPTFIHSRGPWGPGNGVSSDPRIARDYYPVISYPPQEGKPAGDWVRKDVVPNQAMLTKLRQYADRTVHEMDAKQFEWPLRHCDDTMRRGQTTVNKAF
ncbi:hypothetical protein [Sciscionella sediminilitoris]|uniref:hypothetical protein n=1 Tax=Sciscionella sediminilitoris TaxID=1445613 RepID=UPI0004DF9390|nr:hypothetical protein [Sciscionella sp. SE31]